MVLIAELLLAVAILAGVYRFATSTGDRLSVVEPDSTPSANPDGPLTAEELVALRIPAGFGYRKIDVDRLLDRLARQLPSGPAHQPAAEAHQHHPMATATDPDRQVSLEKEPEHG